MATAPVKPQLKSLHNFPVSLKWGNITGGRPAPPPLPNDSETDSDPDAFRRQHRRPPPPPAGASMAPHRVGSRSARQQRFSFSSCSSILPKPMPKQQTVTVHEKPSAAEEQLRKGGGGEAEEVEEEENHQRPWKLRPRRGLYCSPVGSGELTMQQPKDKAQQQTPAKSMRLRGLAEDLGGGGGGGGVSFERKEKRKFWIALSKEEIEEDVFILTGSRPSRRPMKRPKNVQKLVDNVFPGLWLVGATVDSYRIPDTPIKR
ncbi:unnamed protein product [Linum tenue]|uniref:DUF1639 family protein n=1 Tax=Linum tenue TaxID=586396 RepID=A0AAV0Q347_9ROSI|nr:unnamed protein product [Linum tenue]